MVGKFALLVAAALVLPATAGPIHRPEGIAIPMHRRSSLTLPNGVFDHDKAVLDTVFTTNKYRQNLINLERRGNFPESARILPFAVLPRVIDERLQKRQSEPLAYEDSDRDSWVGTITIGMPGRPFLVDFDTGSSDLWVPSASCTDPGCTGKNKYVASDSETARPQPGTFENQFGEDSTVSGPVYTDTVTVAGIVAHDQYFSPVTTVSPAFEEDKIDGIMGLAFPSLSELNQNPFFFTAVAQGAVSTPSFSIKLAEKGSELFLGGTNIKLFTGSVESHKLSSDSGFWEIGNAAVTINGGQEAISGIDTVIDSGTTLIYGPTSSVKTLYDKVPGSSLFDSEVGLYLFPCDSIPAIAFNWGGRDWVISADNFNLGETLPGSGKCVGAIAGTDLGLGGNVWLLGVRFMKNVYTVFDIGAKTVGFATLV